MCGGGGRGGDTVRELLELLLTNIVDQLGHERVGGIVSTVSVHVWQDEPWVWTPCVCSIFRIW